jgi:hypothetical protein
MGLASWIAGSRWPLRQLRTTSGDPPVVIVSRPAAAMLRLVGVGAPDHLLSASHLRCVDLALELFTSKPQMLFRLSVERQRTDLACCSRAVGCFGCLVESPCFIRRAQRGVDALQLVLKVASLVELLASAIVFEVERAVRMMLQPLASDRPR